MFSAYGCMARRDVDVAGCVFPALPFKFFVPILLLAFL